MAAPDHPADYPACRCDACVSAYIAPPQLVTLIKFLLAALVLVLVVSALQ